MGRVVIPGFRKIETSGGGGGTGNYNNLENKPSINNVPLVGNLKTVDLKLTDATLTEEGVPAEAKEVGGRLEAQSTALNTLSKQLGSHTIKSDVPENAVFTDTVYDDAEVKESISQQSTEMMDIKMLGWNVPRECPVQNEVNGNQFIQKVGRGNLGSLDWTYDSSIPRFYSGDLQTFIKKVKSESDMFSGYLKGYKNLSLNDLFSATEDKAVAESPNGTISIKDSSYTDAATFKSSMQGQYFYYELATPITTTIDGNEIGEEVSDVRKETTANLLNPTLETTTQNNVTCTNNGDGTYTLNGTNSSDTNFRFIAGSVTITNEDIYKLVGCPADKSIDTTHMYLNNTDFSIVLNDVGDGDYKILPSGIYYIQIEVKGNETVNNVLFKPMLTTNLSATYNNFVPYTGNTGKLNSDVAALLKRIEALESLKNKTDTTVTE